MPLAQQHIPVHISTCVSIGHSLHHHQVRPSSLLHSISESEDHKCQLEFGAPQRRTKRDVLNRASKLTGSLVHETAGTSFSKMIFATRVHKSTVVQRRRRCVPAYKRAYVCNFCVKENLVRNHSFSRFCITPWHLNSIASYHLFLPSCAELWWEDTQVSILHHIK